MSKIFGKRFITTNQPNTKFIQQLAIRWIVHRKIQDPIRGNLSILDLEEETWGPQNSSRSIYKIINTIMNTSKPID